MAHEAPSKSAASGAKDQVARLLTLVPYLHSHPQVRLDETAAAVGSTPEQVVKDLGVLFMCGLPGGFPDDLIDVDLEALEDPDGGGPRPEGVIRVSNADYLARPLRLSPTEASAIIVALRALRGSAGEETPRGGGPRAGQAGGAPRRPRSAGRRWWSPGTTTTPRWRGCASPSRAPCSAAARSG